ncbi:hypothetical protein [Streptomyces sp. NPDC008001]|uniref:hypothetical protein n=1 Tax=Streptomyces sp. NPDC008001 TaxID=3364804 RepID=UPI0036ECE67D
MGDGLQNVPAAGESTATPATVTVEEKAEAIRDLAAAETLAALAACTTRLAPT